MKKAYLFMGIVRNLAALMVCLLLIFAIGKGVFMIYNRGVEAFTLGDMAQVWLYDLTIIMFMKRFDSSCSSFETKGSYNSLEVVDTGKFTEIIFYGHDRCLISHTF